MKLDPLKQFASLREKLGRRKAELESELASINAALSGAPAPAHTAEAPAKRASRVVKAPRGGARGPRPKNELSLKEAVLKVIQTQPLTKQEILDGVLAQGYKFAAKNPLNSLNTLLYSDSAFTNHDGKFGPAAPAA